MKLDEVVAALSRSLPAGAAEASYFGDGSLPPALAGTLFEAGSRTGASRFAARVPARRWR